jgi:hypothetical protein
MAPDRGPCSDTLKTIEKPRVEPLYQWIKTMAADFQKDLMKWLEGRMRKKLEVLAVHQNEQRIAPRRTVTQ